MFYRSILRCHVIVSNSFVLRPPRGSAYKIALNSSSGQPEEWEGAGNTPPCPRSARPSSAWRRDAICHYLQRCSNVRFSERSFRAGGHNITEMVRLKRKWDASWGSTLPGDRPLKSFLRSHSNLYSIACSIRRRLEWPDTRYSENRVPFSSTAANLVLSVPENRDARIARSPLI